MYYYDVILHHEFLKYDFEWWIGKEIPMYYKWDKEIKDYVYESLDEISQIELLDGNQYECLYYDYYEDSILSPLLIKGVGYVGYWEPLFKHWSGITGWLQYQCVMSFSRNGQLLYESSFEEIKERLEAWVYGLDTGIQKVRDKKPYESCYGVDGMEKPYPIKGLNIIRMQDGTVRKVMK